LPELNWIDRLICEMVISSRAVSVQRR